MLVFSSKLLLCLKICNEKGFQISGVSLAQLMVFSLQNEALNGGGTLFVEKHKNLRVRVVHGNTLTAAVIIKQLPEDVKEVFMTGATSKLGRAIGLYLSQRGVRVLVGSIHFNHKLLNPKTLAAWELQNVHLGSDSWVPGFLAHILKGWECNEDITLIYVSRGAVWEL